MALVLANRIQETTTTTGTGTITLAGAASGFQSFAVVGNGNTTYYAITSGTAWEVGIGTYTSVGTTLARTTILASSAAGAAITLAGTSTVFATYPAERAVSTDNTATLTNKTLSLEAHSTAATVTAGTNAQGQGALTNDHNIITTAASNPSGVTLPTAFIGARIVVVNKGTNPINIYPATGGNINGGSANAAIVCAVGASVTFVATSTTAWYTVSGYNTTGAGFVPTSQGGTGLSGSAPFSTGGAFYATSTTNMTTGTLPYYAGGTGVSAVPNNGELLIGNGSNWSKSTITAGSGISISNGSGSITISASGGGSSGALTYLGSTSLFSSPTTLSIGAPSTGRLLLIFENVNYNGVMDMQFTNFGSTVTSGYNYNLMYTNFGMVSVTSGTSATSIPLINSGFTSNTANGYLILDGPFNTTPSSYNPAVNGQMSDSSATYVIGGNNTSFFSGSAGIVINASGGFMGGTIYAYGYQ